MCDISNTRKLFTIVLISRLVYAQFDYNNPNSDPRQNPRFENRFEPGDDNRFDPGVGRDPSRFDLGVDRDSNRFGSGVERDPSRFDTGVAGRDIRALLQALDLQGSQECTRNVDAQWNFETNVNQATQLEAVSDFIEQEVLGKINNKIERHVLKLLFQQLSVM